MTTAHPQTRVHLCALTDLVPERGAVALVDGEPAAVAFVFDPATRQWRDYRIIAARDQFAPGPAKRADLVDVVFSSGIETMGAVTRLYAGTSDAEAQWVEIDYPFDIPRYDAAARHVVE